MHHRFTHLDTGRIAVEQDSSDLLLQQVRELTELLKVRLFAHDGRGQLTVQPIQGRVQLCLISHFHHHSGRAKHFLLQHLVAIDQQADIGLEQLRLRLMTLLRIARQVLDARMI